MTRRFPFSLLVTSLSLCLLAFSGCSEPTSSTPDKDDLSAFLADNPEIANAEPPEIETE